MSAPADLEGLPWPDGEPGPLRSCASRLRGLAGGFDGAGTRLGGAVAPAWSGFAATSYSGTLGHAQAAVSHLGGSLDTAAGALAHLADVIEHAQHEVRVAAAKLHDARAAAARAQRIAQAARDDADRAHTAAALAPGLMPGDPLSMQADAAERHALSTATTAGSLQQDAARVERWAHQEADDAVKRVKAADAHCASALEGTGMAGGPALGGAATAAGAQSVWDFVYDVAGKPLNPWDPATRPARAQGLGRLRLRPAVRHLGVDQPLRLEELDALRARLLGARAALGGAPTPARRRAAAPRRSRATCARAAGVGAGGPGPGRARQVGLARGEVRQVGTVAAFATAASASTSPIGQGLHDLRADRPHHRPDGDVGTASALGGWAARQAARRSAR